MLPIEIDIAGNENMPTISALSDRHDLTVYDAAYLELALRKELALATLDKELTAAARAAGVSVLP
ncbi:MAG: type II toxin-antitoxin system VapC family toxin [Devosia sp.]